MLMNTAKGYSALFPSVSQPIQGQGYMRSLSPGRISQFSVRLPVPRLCSYSQCIICSGFTPLLSSEQGLLHLGHNQALQIQVLCTVSFTTKFTFFLGVVDSRLFPHLTHRTPFLCQSFPALMIFSAVYLETSHLEHFSVSSYF